MNSGILSVNSCHIYRSMGCGNNDRFFALVLFEESTWKDMSSLYTKSIATQIEWAITTAVVAIGVYTNMKCLTDVLKRFQGIYVQ